jgi:sugar/nucleoside kinase (ribokinase family)
MTDAICLGKLLVDFVPTETGKDLIEAAAYKKAAGGAPANVAVGLKRLGISSGFMGAVPSFTVKAVDATGAGDAFTAGLLAGLLNQPKAIQNEPMLKRVCRFANAVGALTTTARGATPSLPTRQRVEEFLETHKSSKGA